jgi:predicted transcriptional regulator
MPTTMKALRTALGKSQMDLARETGLSLFSIHRLETGAELNPRLSTLRSLAASLGVSVGELAKVLCPEAPIKTDEP